MLRLVKYRYRCARTGKLVIKQYAKNNPDTTIRERFWFWQREFKEIA